MWAAAFVSVVGVVMAVLGFGGKAATVVALFGHPISTGTLGIVIAYLGYCTAFAANRRARGVPYSLRTELRARTGVLVYAVLNALLVGAVMAALVGLVVILLR
jgi:hypothetical protein